MGIWGIRLKGLTSRLVTVTTNIFHLDAALLSRCHLPHFRLLLVEISPRREVKERIRPGRLCRVSWLSPSTTMYDSTICHLGGLSAVPFSQHLGDHIFLATKLPRAQRRITDDHLVVLDGNSCPWMAGTPACPSSQCGDRILNTEEHIFEKSMFRHPFLDSRPSSPSELRSTRLSFHRFPSPPGHGLRSQRVNIIDVDAPWHHLALCMILLLHRDAAIGRRLLRLVHAPLRQGPPRPGGEWATSLMPSHAFLKSIYMSDGANAFHTVCIPLAPPIV